MMLRLGVNVSGYRFDAREVHGERRVALLPRKRLSIGKFVVDPTGRHGFDRTNKLGDGDIAGELDEQVNMIFDAADSHQGTFAVAGQPAQIRVESFGHVGEEESLSVLGAENDCGMGVLSNAPLELKKPLQYQALPGLAKLGRSVGAMIVTTIVIAQNGRRQCTRVFAPKEHTILARPGRAWYCIDIL